MSDTRSLSWAQLAVTFIQDQNYEYTNFILNANRSIFC